MKGLDDPLLDSNAPVTGVDKGQHSKENKRKRLLKQSIQGSKYYWSHHTGKFSIPSTNQGPKTYKGSIFQKFWPYTILMQEICYSLQRRAAQQWQGNFGI